MQSNSSTALDSSPVTSSVTSATQDSLNKSSAAPLNLNNSEGSGSSLTIERPLAEVISEKFLPFDSAMYIVSPFDAEVARDLEVHEEYTTMLLDAVLHTHAWASGRFKRRTQLESQKLEDQHLKIIKTEEEQEKTRGSLADFVTKMKNALAALTGIEA